MQLKSLREMMMMMKGFLFSSLMRTLMTSQDGWKWRRCEPSRRVSCCVGLSDDD